VLAYGVTAFLLIFSAFNLAAAAGAAGAAMRLMTPEGRDGFASPRIHKLVLALAWGLALIALGATGAAWGLYHSGHARFAPLILAPIGWLIVSGLVVAIVDFAEDGVFGNAWRRPD
jgi:hypothetical protein